MKTALADMDAVCRQAFANLLERQIRFVGHQPQKTIFVRQKLGRRMAMHRLRFDATGLALALHPFEGRRGADLKATARAELTALIGRWRKSNE